MIRQGHRYGYRTREVLALESELVPGQQVCVAVIDVSRPWALGEPTLAAPAELQALPMRYFHGQTPRTGDAHPQHIDNEELAPFFEAQPPDSFN